jgi:hypothetical protein
MTGSTEHVNEQQPARAVVVTVQDARSSNAPTSMRA